jgi:tRNA-dihydrouridine synthase
LPNAGRGLRRAVGAVSIPICGNGGVERHADLERLRAETGCAYAMVGRAALGDPWIFSGEEVTPRRAAGFLHDYAERMTSLRGASIRAAAGRVKQLLKHWTAGGLLELQSVNWLRLADPKDLLDRVARAAGAEGAGVAGAGIAGAGIAGAGIAGAGVAPAGTPTRA